MDEEGIEPKDIELVVSQVNCSRAKAVEALRSWVAVTAFFVTHSMAQSTKYGERQAEMLFPCSLGQSKEFGMCGSRSS